MNYARFLNSHSLARKLVSTRMNKLNSKTLNFADVSPNSRLFPFKSMNFTLSDGSILDFNEEVTRTALQYCPSSGNTELVNWLMDFQASMHNPPSFKKNSHIKQKICLTSGSMEGLCKSFEMLISEGDDVLIESPTYSGVISALEPLGCNIVTVQTDHNGIIPTLLANTLQQYHNNNTNNKEEDQGAVNDTTNNLNNNNNSNNNSNYIEATTTNIINNHSNNINNNKKPFKFLYTVPNGGNPTGASTAYERKEEIYELARKHDLLILEDDPYFFLQYNKPRSNSYLSMDTDGRVLRFDSFSKILSSGIRLGFVTGANQLVDHLSSHMSTSTGHASHLSQMMVLELLKRWKIEGFERHIGSIVDFYRAQKEAMIRCAVKRLTDLAEWSEPVAGMFLWMKLLGIEDSQKLIEEKALEKKVLLVPGRAFLPTNSPPSCHVRASFSQSDEGRMDEGFKRLQQLMKHELNLPK